MNSQSQYDKRSIDMSEDERDIVSLVAAELPREWGRPAETLRALYTRWDAAAPRPEHDCMAGDQCLAVAWRSVAFTERAKRKAAEDAAYRR